MRWCPALVALCLGQANAILGGCPALSRSPYLAQASPFGWPVSPNNWTFAEQGHWPQRYVLCEGHRQSPMDITGACVQGGGAEGALKPAAAYAVADNRPMVTISPYMRSAFVAGAFGSLHLEDESGHKVEYVAHQVHLSADSWHRTDGQSHAAELMILHKPKGQPDMLRGGVVLSVLFDHDESENALFKHMGFDKDGPEMEAMSSWPAPHFLDLQEALQDALGGPSYSYDGSVPVPPCSETVKYIVLGQALKVHPAQTQKLKDFLACFAGGYKKREPMANPSHGQCRPVTMNSLKVSSPHHGETCEAIGADQRYRAADCWDAGLSASDMEKCVTSPIDVDITKANAAQAAVGPVPVFTLKTVNRVTVEPGNYTLDASPEVFAVPAAVPNFGSVVVNGRSFLLHKLSVKPISSHSYQGRRYAAELQVEAIMDGDGFSKLVDISGVHSGGDTGSGSHDSGSHDSGSHDTGSHDTGSHDTGSHDTGSHDTDTHGEGHRRLQGGAQEPHRVIMSFPLKLGQESILLRQLGLPFEAYRDSITAMHSYTIETTVDLPSGLRQALDGPWLWYRGGAVFPGCPDWGVRWILFQTPMDISIAQLNYLDLKVSGMDSTRLDGPMMDAAAYKAQVWLDSLPAMAVDKHSTCASEGWNYDDPTCWSEQYPVCSEGTRQSPINIERSKVTRQGKDLFLPQVSWRPVQDLHVTNFGKGLMVSSNQLGYITLTGEDGFPDFFEVAQIHLHMPSEHTLEGETYAAELQVVHRHQKTVVQPHNSADNFPFVTTSFFFQIGDRESTLLKQMFLPGIMEPDTYRVMELPLDLARHLGPALDGDFYVYEGSSTTPDCHEMNKWFIFDHAFSMSMDQWATFKAMFPSPGNNRPIQPMKQQIVAKNSFEGGTPIYFDFYLSRHIGRNRFYPGEGYILVPISAALVLMCAVMFFIFKRDLVSKKSSMASLAETIGLREASRV